MLGLRGEGERREERDNGREEWEGEIETGREEGGRVREEREKG